jgi:uncharacterized Zn-binding protein involved in type VI secretion
MGFPPARATTCATHDFAVVSGAVSDTNPHVLSHGLQVAAVGTKVACTGLTMGGPVHPPAPNGPIFAVGAALVLGGGKPAARESPSGDIITCSSQCGLPVHLPQMVEIGGPSMLDMAREEARAMLKKRLADLDRWSKEDRERFKKWFGDDSDATRQMMRERCQKELALLDTYGPGNFRGLEPDNDGKVPYGIFAQVDPDNDRQVQIGNSFAKSGPDGADTRGGVLVHEMSHFKSVSGTDDYAYGQKALAQKEPSKAQHHADNFEYWAENR